MPRATDDKKESWVENYLRDQCVVHGALCEKLKGRRGWPDRSVFWFFGVKDLIETKRPKGGVFEPLQTRVHAKLRRMGHTVFVLNTREQVDEYICARLQYSRRSALSVRPARSEDDD